MKNKVIVITGAASGLGKSIALELSAKGNKIIILDILKKQGEALVKLINESKGDAVFLQVDLSNASQIKKIFNNINSTFRVVDVLINNARPKLQKFDMEEGFEEWDEAINILLKAPGLCATEASKLMKNKGAIINISSTNAKTISHQPMVYHVGKAGLEHMTRYLSVQLAEKNIVVNTLSIGLIDIVDEGRKVFSEDRTNKAVIEMTVPLKRAANIKDIVKAIVFLSSSSADYITGQTLILDGGIINQDHFHVSLKSFLKEKI